MKCQGDFDAEHFVVEVNFGGDVATELVKQAAERGFSVGWRESNLLRIREVLRSRQGHARRTD